MADGKLYTAFISYSQADKAWGKRIHNWLETYRVPVGVMVDVSTDRRLGRFFRDEEEMPAATDIAAVVRRAIEVAESLIVICSPRSAQSQWVEAEIEYFRRANPSGKIFAVIIDGEPNADDLARECFPPALRVVTDPTEDDSMPIEPVGLDVRVDGKARICARLAAGILGVDFNDLWQRDRRRAEARQRRTIMVLSAVSTVFAVLAITAIALGVSARRNAAEARRQAEIATAARIELQREYLSMIGESAINQVLANGNDPGALTISSPVDWIILMERRQNAFAAARDFGLGRVLAVAHDGVLQGVRSTRGDAFLRRTIGWLRGPVRPQSVLIASGHCEWVPNDAPDWRLPTLLRDWGYSVSTAPELIDDAALTEAGVLIIGNAWGDFTPDEVAAIERFTRDGGGVLLAGLGWSWSQYADDPDFQCPDLHALQSAENIATYPMNRVAAPFGVQWLDDSVSRTR
ncbi:hypothetical protein U91I_02673 [alpha proteobacterium U9-1i]|nr:hypothetical protein U91I_02673 [alpha proteobacterium U9-1i]